MQRVVKPDTERQAPWLSYKVHPWFPVLAIGAYKAELYTRALVDDVVHKRQNLADPGWLTRVGLYLELMTALGVIEAVRDDLGDLLTPEERAAADRWDDLTINVDGWRGVWALRKIAQPIGLRNLLAKKKATLEFLHVHHEDLKHAIALAGPNRTNAQETWHRVFRDAERAVLCKTPAAFPELGMLPEELREFVLWHRRGHLSLRRALRVPGPLPKLVGDQDGLFASACNQYRASMNHVAEWAAEQGLMEHAGGECVPRQVSLLEAHMNQPSRVALLQARDGYDPERPLEVGEDLPSDYTPPLQDVAALLSGTPIFSALTAEELDTLARDRAAAHVRPGRTDHRAGRAGRQPVRRRRRHRRGVPAPSRRRGGGPGHAAAGRRAGRDVTAHGRAPVRHGAGGGRRARLRGGPAAVRADPRRPPGAQAGARRRDADAAPGSGRASYRVVTVT